MKQMTTMVGILAVFTALGSNVALSQKMDHSKMDHSKMDHSEMGMTQKSEAVGKGVINSVDVDANMINITHEPMSELGWPQMTMDLPVTRKVDLEKIKDGDNVSFTMKLGRDKKYRVINLTPVGNELPSEASKN